MILDPESTSHPSKKELEANQERERAQAEYTDELPPDYTSILESGASPTTSPPPPMAMSMSTSSSTSNSRSSFLPDLKSSNFVHLSRTNSSVKGVWIIDPSMIIPSAFLPALLSGQTEETRDNMHLQTKNGVVDAEIYLLPRSTHKDQDGTVADVKTPQRSQVVFRARSSNGSVSMKIHEVPPNTTGETKPPMHIDCFSSNGSVTIYIPRTFHGPISITTKNGSVHFSEAIKPLLTIFSEVDKEQRCFLGNFDAQRWVGTGEWTGDMLKAESLNGSVKILFDDEQRLFSSSSSSSRSRSQGGGFFTRIFSGF